MRFFQQSDEKIRDGQRKRMCGLDCVFYLEYLYVVSLLVSFALYIRSLSGGFVPNRTYNNILS